MALRLVYLIFIRLLDAVALLLRSDVSKEAEILVVRHEVLFVPNGGERPSSPCRRSGEVKLEEA